MPHRTTLKIDYFVYKSQQIQKVNMFSFVFKVMEYPQTRTQKFNLNQEKNALLCHPLQFRKGGAVATPLVFGMTPLDKTFTTVL